jgi:organic hydroperoxide reductase OsmC/OhrA
MSEEHVFHASASWSPEAKEGRLKNGDGTFAVPFSAAPSLGGKNGFANPEELLLSALAACFVQTWAICLAKLKVPIESPLLDGSCEVDKDPDGGYRVTKFDLVPHVPKAVWDARQEDVEKSLSLAEKFCIVSKAVRGGGRDLLVTPKLVD